MFLPGASEIRRASEELAGPAASLGFDVVPLHGDLPPEAQDRAVRPGPRRRVILSTNVAETSLTIEGVTLVVDSGLARTARTSPWTGLSSLELIPLSSITRDAGLDSCEDLCRAGARGLVSDGVPLRDGRRWPSDRLHVQRDLKRRRPTGDLRARL
ncbi:MAG: helicase-related protein [Sandaracinaceae bacterium]|nr:helicase-related protein [Sandaracinaceae bacterium]